MESLDRALRKVEDAFLWLAVAVLVLITLGVGLEVILRYAFNSPLQGTIQLSEIGLLYITFLGTAWCMRTNQHVRIELVYQFLPDRWRNAFDILASFLGLIVCAAFVGFGTTVTWSHYSRGMYTPTSLDVPNWVMLVVIPLGALPLALRFLIQFIHFCRGGRRTLQEY